MAKFPYLDATLSTQVRSHDLLARMSLAEKIAQMQGVREQKKRLEDHLGRFDGRHAQTIFPHGIGHFARPSERSDPTGPNRTPAESVRFGNAIQKWLIENTRWGIPALFHEETLHGHAARHSTCFPQAIGLASSFNPSLVEQVMAVAATEMRCRGGHQAFAPVLDIARDPRWGRIEETYGEDPYLATTLGLAALRGLQGTSSAELKHDKVIATLKHLAGHGEPQGGQNTAPCNIGERTLRELFLLPFEACVRLMEVRSVMASYNEIDGIPSHINVHLLQNILRREWGFNGTVISDYYALDELINYHGICNDPAYIAQLALNAGVDVDLPDGKTYRQLSQLVSSGTVSEAVIDQAVLRVLRDKFDLGLFEKPYADEGRAAAMIGCDQHSDLAYSAALQSIILLKNDQSILPINAGKYNSIALIGPHTNDCLLGGYSDVPLNTVTIHQAMARHLEERNIQLYQHPGCHITRDDWPKGKDSLAANSFSKERWLRDSVELGEVNRNLQLIAEAEQLAADTDLVVLVIGENEAVCREAWSADHLGDSHSLQLIAQQDLLLERILATGTPTIVVLQNGRPLALGEYNHRITTLLEIWYAGQRGGDALVDILFGKVSPSGRLPVSFPRSVGHLPAYYNHKPTAKRGYLLDKNHSVFGFGHGLTYSEFEYSKLSVIQLPTPEQPSITLRCTVRNVGAVAATEVVQLYVAHRYSGVSPRPQLELKGFHRCNLEPAQAASIEFCLPASMLGHFNLDMDYEVFLGEIRLIIGSSSTDHQLETTLDIHQHFACSGENRQYICESRNITPAN